MHFVTRRKNSSSSRFYIDLRELSSFLSIRRRFLIIIREGKDGRNFYRAIWSKDLEKRNCIIISIGYSSNLLRENKYSEENDRYYVLIDCFISITY